MIKKLSLINKKLIAIKIFLSQLISKVLATKILHHKKYNLIKKILGNKIEYISDENLCRK